MKGVAYVVAGWVQDIETLTKSLRKYTWRSFLARDVELRVVKGRRTLRPSAPSVTPSL